MERADILLAAVHNAWCAVSLSLGEAPVPLAEIPVWRRAALEHTIGFWESWHQYDDIDVDHFCAVTHYTWLQYHRRNGWTYSALVPFVSLAEPQQRKLVAMLRAYLLVREQLGAPAFDQ